MATLADYLRGVYSRGSRVLLLFVCFLALVVSGCRSTGQHRVNLSWSAPINSPVKTVGYNIYRRQAGSTSYQRLNTSVETKTIYVDTAVQSGLTYHYYVKTVSDSGLESPPSDPVVVTIP
jgi:fibronectin type 3 domain-containing protein